MKTFDERLTNLIIFGVPLSNKELIDLTPTYIVLSLIFIILFLLYFWIIG